MLSTLLICGALVLVWSLLSRKHPSYPPGPYCWPIVGNSRMFYSAGKEAYKVMGDLRRRYGNVVGVYLGPKPVVIVSGLTEIRDMLSRAECQHRPQSVTRNYDNDNYGLLFSRNDAWQEQRRFALRHLRDLGVGKRALETLIHEEVVDMLDDVTKMAGHNYTQPVPVCDVINSTGANVIYHLLAGERFKRGDPQLTHLLKMIKEAGSLADASGGLINSYPFLLKYGRWLTPYEKLKKFRVGLKSFLQEKVDEHDAKHLNEESFDFIDFYLAEINKKVPGSSFHMKQLLAICYDFFLAGSDTTVGSLSFALLYMLREPAIQARIHAEIDAVVGRETLPSVDDRQRMNYVNATLLESLRMGSIVPLAVPHSAVESFNFRSHVIPKDARIIINLYELHNAKDIWGDPENFRPERFLDSTGELVNHDALMPFGMGKRSCPGESMARTNIFLTFTALLQKFTLSVPSGEPTPSLEPVGSFTLTCRPYNIQFTPRS